MWQPFSVPMLHNARLPAASPHRFREAFANHALMDDTLGWCVVADSLPSPTRLCFPPWVAPALAGRQSLLAGGPPR